MLDRYFDKLIILDFVKKCTDLITRLTKKETLKTNIVLIKPARMVILYLGHKNRYKKINIYKL